jgi:4'-phosphopantetheinyl transferase
LPVNPLVIILNAGRDLSEREFLALLALVPPETRDRIRRRRDYRAAQNSLLGDLLARREIGERAGIAPEQVVFRVNAYGKPFVEGGPCFNIAHSGRVIAVAVDTLPVGIDIELGYPALKPGVRGRDTEGRIARRFFTPDERLYIDGAEGRRERFYDVWTMKEAYIKKAGLGLAMGLRSFSVFRPPPGNFFHKLVSNGITGYVCTARLVEPEYRFPRIRDLLELEQARFPGDSRGLRPAYNL